MNSVSNYHVRSDEGKPGFIPGKGDTKGFGSPKNLIPKQPHTIEKTTEVGQKISEIKTNEELKTQRDLLEKNKFKLIKLENKITGPKNETKIQFIQNFFYSILFKEKFKNLEALKKAEEEKENKEKKDLGESIKDIEGLIELFEQKKSEKAASDLKIENFIDEKIPAQGEHLRATSPAPVASFDEEENHSLFKEKKIEPSPQKSITERPIDQHNELIAKIRQIEIEKILKESELKDESEKQVNDIVSESTVKTPVGELVKSGNKTESLQEILANKVKNLNRPPSQKPSTEGIYRLFSELNQMDAQNNEQRAQIDDTKIYLINLLREKASRNKKNAEDVLKKLIEQGDPVMIKNLSEKEIKELLANKVKNLTRLPRQKPSTEAINRLLSELNQMAAHNNEQRAQIDETKLFLINLLREKTSRNKQEAESVLKKLIEQGDPVMIRNLSEKEIIMIKNLSEKEKINLINAHPSARQIPGKLSNLSVRSWADKDILGPRTEYGKTDGRHVDAFDRFRVLYKELCTSLLGFPAVSENDKHPINQMVDIYEEFNKEHEQFVLDEAFAKKMISKEKVAFTPEELKKINAYRTKIEELKNRIENHKTGLQKFGNAGLTMEGYLTIPINAILRSLENLLN